MRTKRRSNAFDRHLNSKGAVNEMHEKNVLELHFFLLKSLVLGEERAKSAFKYVQKHLYYPKHVLLCIIFLNARDVTWV